MFFPPAVPRPQMPRRPQSTLNGHVCVLGPVLDKRGQLCLPSSTPGRPGSFHTSLYGWGVSGFPGLAREGSQGPTGQGCAALRADPVLFPCSWRWS